MLIQSLEQTFTVIQLRGTTDVSESYLCRDYDQQNPSDYMLVKIKDQDFAQKLIPIFLQIQQERTFLDFVGSFTQEDTLYAAFHSSDFPTLAQKMERENCGLSERLEIVKNLWDKMILYKMPLYFQQHIFSMDRVCVSSALEIGFRYELQDFNNYFEVEPEQVIHALWYFLQELFSQELQQHSCMELERFCNRLVGFTGSLEDLYQDFAELYHQLQGNQGQASPPQRDGTPFRLWEIVKRIARLLKPVLAAIVLIAIVIYLIFMLNTDQSPVDGAGKFDFIGTVEIVE